MKIKNIQHLELFVRTADLASISAAARKLDLSPAVASAALKRFEADIGAMLFIRSTRSMRLTLEGERLLLRARPILDDLRDTEEELSAGNVTVRGQLQLSMPSDLGRNVLLPWLDAFQATYPDVSLRIHVSDRIADVYRQSVDIGIRYGMPADSSLVALPLSIDNTRVLCAAPGYLEKHGTPASPADLIHHNCLCFMRGDSVNNRWLFEKAGERLTIKVSGDRVSDDSDLVRRWAIAGHGIVHRSWLDMQEAVQQKKLTVICRDWQGEAAPLYLVCAGRRQVSPLVRLLRDYLAEQLSLIPKPT